MPLWEKTKLEMLYGDGPGGPHTCDVVLTASHMKVSYVMNGTHLVYEGDVNDAGVVQLHSRPGPAELTLDSDKEVAVGKWTRGNEHGTWLIHLPDLEWPVD